MARIMKNAALSCTALFVLFAAANSCFDTAFLLPLAISFGTAAYHLLMRLAVGFAVNAVMQNRADPNKSRYRIRPFEAKLYRLLGVKRWKAQLPSYDPALFCPKQHSWAEIAQAMCQAETVHTVIAVLSFVPLLFSLRWGAFAVFLITSLLSASFDLLFVIMQRFNRPRVLRMVQREQKKNAAVLGGTQCQDL
ncbi:MAG: hypothetical protein IJC61_05850 [Oscillospiraceae bacterium]|nr:hypothetical protein [Oscillospiraceae bacterium]